MADCSPQKQQKEKAGHNLFQCSACKRTYTRVDHLARHVRSHLHERPFQCQTCNKAFGRLDLLKRHAACHQDDGDSSRTRRSHANSQSSRVSQACRECAATKLKCDDVKPCGRCRQRGLTCEYVSDGREHLKMMTASSPGPDTSSPQCEPESTATTETDVQDKMPIDPALQRQPLTLPAQGPRPGPEPASATVPVRVPLPPPPPPPPTLPTFHEHDMTDFLRDVMTPNLPSFSTRAWLDADAMGPRGLLDFTSDGVEFDDTDFGFLDESCGGEPFTLATAAAMAMGPVPGMEPSAHHHHHQQQQQQSFPPAMFAQMPETAATALTAMALAPTQSPTAANKRRNVGLGTEAFKRSTLGMWLPAVHDGTDAELEHLSALSAEAGSTPDTTRLHVDAEHRCLNEGLSRAARDGVLAMVLRSCRPERALTVVQTFPPAELLDDLIACFFAQHRQHADSFLHVATFDPNAQQPELIGAIAAFGATLADARPLHRLGFAIQEAVRTTVPSRCEAANTTTRELWLLQAFMCELQVAMWSGIKRKMEIAESHAPVLYTMLRRAGRFHRLHRPVAEAPLPSDGGAVLQRKWHDWVKQESLRRLALHAAIFDAQVSMARLTNPIISYAELSIPLPASLALWVAEDAEQWKAQYLRETGSMKEVGAKYEAEAARQKEEEEEDRDRDDDRDLSRDQNRDRNRDRDRGRDRDRHRAQHDRSLPDFLQPQPAELPAHCDSHFSSLTILYGIWGMVWQHLQHVATLQRSGQPSALASLRRQELLLTLHNFRLSIIDVDMDVADGSGAAGHGHGHGHGHHPQHSSEANLVLELLHMYLHINLGDMQLFAGKEDVEEARRVLPSLQQWWADGAGARQAVFHAGQVLRVAKAFAPRRLCRFYAIAVYHAGLTLWVYGVIWLSQQSRQQLQLQSQQHHNQPVYLDGPETATTQRFIAMGRGTPCVGFHYGGNPTVDVVPLSDPEAVMDLVVETLLGNFPAAVKAQEPPPIVQNLVQLLRGLGKAAGEMSA